MKKGYIMPIGEGGVGKTTLAGITDAAVGGNVFKGTTRTTKDSFKDIKLLNPDLNDLSAVSFSGNNIESKIIDFPGNPSPNQVGQAGGYFNLTDAILYVFSGDSKEFETSLNSLKNDGKWGTWVDRFNFKGDQKTALYGSKILTPASIADVKDGKPLIEESDLELIIGLAKEINSEFIFVGDALGGGNEISPKPAKLWAYNGEKLIETSIIAAYTVPLIANFEAKGFTIPDKVSNYVRSLKLSL
ncbi:MAG: hypothetical protein WC307_03715 [Candidatus Nanoarchaeia archaeon]